MNPFERLIKSFNKAFYAEPGATATPSNDVPVEPQLSWGGKPVQLIRHETMDEVPLPIVAMGGFFGGIAPDGIFVEVAKDQIVVRDCRKALGGEIDPAVTDELFVQQTLDQRLGSHPSGGIVVRI